MRLTDVKEMFLHMVTQAVVAGSRDDAPLPTQTVSSSRRTHLPKPRPSWPEQITIYHLIELNAKKALLIISSRGFINWVPRAATSDLHDPPLAPATCSPRPAPSGGGLLSAMPVVNERNLCIAAGGP